MPTNNNYTRISVKQNILHVRIFEGVSATNAATKKIGLTKYNKNHGTYYPVVERLSNQQKELRISSIVNNEKMRQLKTQCNRILHDIAIVLNGGKNREIDNLASEIDKHNDNTKIY